MNKALLSIALVFFTGLAFVAGRVTAPPPQYQTGSAANGDDMATAFEDFLKAQKDTIALYQNSPFFGDEQERAEAYRGFLYALVGSIKAGALQSKEHPRFMRAVDWTSKSGLDNPDNNYYVAMISDQANYRITGNRGNTANLIFQLVIGQPGVRGAGSSTNVSVLYDQDIETDSNGNFEIVLSRNEPKDAGNWLPNGEGAETLLVRFTHSDWSKQSNDPLFIERIGMEGTHAAPLTPVDVSADLREAAVSLYDRTATWLNYSERAWTLMPRNDIATARPTRGGLVGQYSAFGSWELQDDEALVISTSASSAAYQGIELGNLWFVSLDYETRTSSLTLDQMQCSKNGRCYAVVSKRDPQIQNWLDTAGHHRGLIMMRWQGLSENLSDDEQPKAELVSFANIRDFLPADVPMFGNAERTAQIRDRRRAIHKRFGG